MRKELILSAIALSGCSMFAPKPPPPPVPFEAKKTPSGEFCSDMKVIFNGEHEPDRAFHRLKTVRTQLIETTAPERLQLLREVACETKGDAVIDAGDYEGVAPDGKRVKFLAGTVIQWTKAPEPTIDTGAGGFKPGGRPAVSLPAESRFVSPSKDDEEDEEAAVAKAKKKKKKADDE